MGACVTGGLFGLMAFLLRPSVPNIMELKQECCKLLDTMPHGKWLLIDQKNGMRILPLDADQGNTAYVLEFVCWPMKQEDEARIVMVEVFSDTTSIHKMITIFPTDKAGELPTTYDVSNRRVLGIVQSTQNFSARKLKRLFEGLDQSLQPTK